MKKEKKNINWFVVVIVVICIMAIGGAITYGILSAIPGTTIINKQEKEVTVNENGIADAVEKVYDSVVVIEGYKNKKAYSSGTGFIYKKDGDKYNVITNYHVIDGCDGVKIRLTNGDAIDATLVGGNQYDDIAVLAINSNKDLKAASIGSSKNARIGDTVFAVGAPINSTVYSWTVTRGILSGKDRLLPMTSSSNNNIFGNYNTNTESWYINLLQIDASINSGNSGGPLANSNGEVIGITNSKLSSSSIENIGFAVPIEDVENVANQVIEKGEVSRPYAGVGLAEIVQAYKAGLIDSYEGLSGVVIGTVEDNSPAAKAGLKKGDIITKINDHVITSVNYFKYYLNRYKVGDKVTISYTRDGKDNTTELELGKKS